MTRKEARTAAEVLDAFARGKELEWCNDTGVWLPVVNPTFNFNDNKYRIKEEPKYRSFKDKEECWAEMQKHSPFGWIRNGDYYQNICGLTTVAVHLDTYIDGFSYKVAFNKFTFIDGTPFGIKEE